MKINNIKIREQKVYSGPPLWYCIAPNGLLMESFMLKSNAVKWAKNTLDFIKKKKHI